MRIEVTQEDISKGRVHSCGKCPIAVALRRTGFPRANAGYSNLWQDDEFFRTPDKVQSFMVVFDMGAIVGPISFEIPWELPA